MIDLDGVIVKNSGQGASEQWYNHDAKLLPGVKDQFNAWERIGAFIIIMTGRKRSCRRSVERLLERHGIFYDVLVVGVSSGTRILINDQKPDYASALAFEIERNTGL